MSIESPPSLTEPEQASGRWRFVRRWLGALASTKGQEEHEAVTIEGGSQGDDSASAVGTVTATDDADLGGRIFDAAWDRHVKETEGEAGRTEGRIFPELVVGAQAYPDPSMWRSDTNLPLTRDEDYGDIGRVLDRLDQEDGFDGRPPRA